MIVAGLSGFAAPSFDRFRPAKKQHKKRTVIIGTPDQVVYTRGFLAWVLICSSDGCHMAYGEICETTHFRVLSSEKAVESTLLTEIVLLLWPMSRPRVILGKGRGKTPGGEGYYSSTGLSCGWDVPTLCLVWVGAGTGGVG